MELDKRIETLTDIQSVTNGCHDWEFMTKKGYFANRIFDFKDLKKCAYGEYAGWREHDNCFLCEDAFDKTFSGEWYAYFIPESTLKPIEAEKAPSKKEREEDQDRLDFCKIFLGCSSWDSNGNLQPGQWSKLDKIELPFSKERAMYLLGKFIFRLDPKDNPRVDK